MSYDPGQYSNRVEILRPTRARDQQGGVVDVYLILKKAWVKAPKYSPASRDESSDKEGARTKVSFLATSKAYEDVLTTDVLRYNGELYDILDALRMDDVETRIDCFRSERAAPVVVFLLTDLVGNSLTIDGKVLTLEQI